MAPTSVYIEVSGGAALKLSLTKAVPVRKIWASIEKARPEVRSTTHCLEAASDGSNLGEAVPATGGDVLLRCRLRKPAAPPAIAKPGRPKGSGLARGFLGGPAPLAGRQPRRRATAPTPETDDALRGIFDDAAIADIAAQERAMLAAALADGRGDAVARELAAFRRKEALPPAARAHAELLDTQGVQVVAARSPRPRLEMASATAALRRYAREMRRRLEDRSRADEGRPLNAAKAPQVELDLRSRCFTLALETLLATARTAGCDAKHAADPAGYLAPGRALLGAHGSASHVAGELRRVGYVVLDGAFDAAAVNALRRDMGAQESARRFLVPPEQRVTGTRGDGVAWLNDDDAARAGANALASAIRALKGVAAALNDADAAAAYRVDDAAMASRYPPAREADASTPYRGYKRHQDNRRPRPGDPCANARAVTAIAYANPGWDAESDGGSLRLYPGTSAADAAPGDGAECVELAPEGGRLVIFDSFLWHEVLPAIARPRFAVTLWITRPELQT